MDRKDHWNAVYAAKRPDEVSWFQPRAEMSLELIRESSIPPDAWILDVGGGAATLVDDLLVLGYRRVAVLDLSFAALTHVRRRLGSGAGLGAGVVADALDTPFSDGSIGLWHDRAVFHFLGDASDRSRYVREARRVVRPGGWILIATFAGDGPARCSGLPVSRYDPDDLRAEFREGFGLVASRREVHHTPSGAVQPFTYCLFRHGQ